MRLPDKIYARVGAFSLVGVANTVAGVTVILVAGLLGANAILSNALGYGTGLIISFTLNSLFTFQGRAINRFTMLRFLSAFAFSFLLNIGAVYLTTTIFGFHGLLASLAGVPLFTGVFYVLCEYWVFRARAESFVN